MIRSGEWVGEAPRRYAYAELGRDHIQSSAEHLIMRRDDEFKFVIYPGSDEGELYALQDDPDEINNLWRDPNHRERRDRAVTEILAWSVLGSYQAHRMPTPKPQVPMTIKR